MTVVAVAVRVLVLVLVLVLVVVLVRGGSGGGPLSALPRRAVPLWCCDAVVLFAFVS